MTEIVHVPLAGRAYDIHIGDGLIAGGGAHIAAIVDRRSWPLSAMKMSQCIIWTA